MDIVNIDIDNIIDRVRSAISVAMLRDLAYILTLSFESPY